MAGRPNGDQSLARIEVLPDEGHLGVRERPTPDAENQDIRLLERFEAREVIGILRVVVDDRDLEASRLQLILGKSRQSLTGPILPFPDHHQNPNGVRTQIGDQKQQAEHECRKERRRRFHRWHPNAPTTPTSTSGIHKLMRPRRRLLPAGRQIPFPVVELQPVPGFAPRLDSLTSLVRRTPDKVNTHRLTNGLLQSRQSPCRTGLAREGTRDDHGTSDKVLTRQIEERLIDRLPEGLLVGRGIPVVGIEPCQFQSCANEPLAHLVAIQQAGTQSIGEHPGKMGLACCGRTANQMAFVLGGTLGRHVIRSLETHRAHTSINRKPSAMI